MKSERRTVSLPQKPYNEPDNYSSLSTQTLYVDGPRARAAGTENICSTPSDRGAIIKIQFGSPEQHYRQGPNDNSN